jgi:hypothetical protein
VIVDYLHVFGTRIGPSEHDPPLIVDADRVLTSQIALKCFKAVAGRRVQGLKKGGGVHHSQFSASYLGEIGRETLRDHAALKDRLGKFPLEAPDHECDVSRRDTYGKAFVSRRDTIRERRDSSDVATSRCTLRAATKRTAGTREAVDLARTRIDALRDSQ